MSYSCFRNPTSVIEMKPEQCPKSADLQGWLYWSSTPTRWWSTGWKPGHLLTHWPITSRFLTIFKALCWVLICRRFKSHGAGCASQDPKASVGGLFAILSDLGPSKGKQGMWIFPEWVYFLPNLLCCQFTNDKPWNFQNTAQLGAVRVTEP